jgi:hypothetical protein
MPINLSYCGNRKGGEWARPAGAQLETLSPKQLEQKMAGDVALVVKCPPRTHKVLSSNPSAAQKKKKREEG